MRAKIKIILIILISLMTTILSLSFSLRAICINTISSSSVNPTIANRVTDLIFDNISGLNNDQLLAIQKNVENSESLHQINSDYFDQAIKYITDNQDITVDKNHINDFSNEVIDIIVTNTDIYLSNDQRDIIKEDIDNKISFDTVYLNVIETLKNNISLLGNIVIHCFGLITSPIWIILLVVMILTLILIIFIKRVNTKEFLFDISFISFISGVLNMLFMFVVQICTYLLNDRFIGQITATDLFDFVVTTIVIITIGLLAVLLSRFTKTNG